MLRAVALVFFFSLSLSLSLLVTGCSGGDPQRADLSPREAGAGESQSRLDTRPPAPDRALAADGQTSRKDRAPTPDLSRPGESSLPVTPGIYLTITATGMAGTYQATKSVSCYDQGIPTMSGSVGSDIVDVHTTTQPQKGQTYSSPNAFVALFLNDPDGSYYPGDGGGSCTLTAQQGWPSVRATFSCTGLKGASSGVAFDIKDGVVVCP
jgi:hypothetical protein